MLQTFVANLKSARSRGLKADIGGGIFSHAELGKAAAAIEKALDALDTVALGNTEYEGLERAAKGAIVLAEGADLKTLVANLKRASFDRKSASIGRGVFGPDELGHAAASIEKLMSELQAVAMGNTEYEDLERGAKAALAFAAGVESASSEGDSAPAPAG